jgi:hypothetical protein
MNTPSFRKVILYLFIKYIAFAIVLGFLNNRFYNLVIKSSINQSEIVKNSIYYVVYVLFFIAFLIMIIIMPMFFVFWIPQRWIFSVALVAIFIFEYFLYTYLSSTADPYNGIYNVLIGLVFFCLFFGSYIFKKFKAIKNTTPT